MGVLCAGMGWDGMGCCGAIWGSVQSCPANQQPGVQPPASPPLPCVQGSAAAPAAPVDAFAWGSIVIGGPLDVNSEFERRLAVGAGIACRLRGKLLEELGECCGSPPQCSHMGQ